MVYILERNVHRWYMLTNWGTWMGMGAPTLVYFSREFHVIYTLFILKEYKSHPFF